MTSAEFEKLLKDQARLYAQDLSHLLVKTSRSKNATVSLSEITKTLHLKDDFIASVSFVGMVTGEFILSGSLTDLQKIFSDQKSGDDIRECLSETLNLVAGGRIGQLSEVFQKLTITPPKIVSGEIQYRKIKNVPFSIQTENGVLRGCFFIDLMNLDLADSYRTIIQGLKVANEQLSSANQRLVEQQTQLVHSEKMASLGMIAAGVAHEINNPLAFVVSNTNVLGSYVDAMRNLLGGYDHLLQVVAAGKPDETKSEIERISELKKREDISFVLEDTQKLLGDSKFGLDRIKGIVSGLKRFSRVDDGGLKRVQINEEIQNALMLLQNELKYKCTVNTNLKATREVECFPSEINQVLVNLIVNAAQAMKSSGGVLQVSTEDAKDAVLIRVRDNGVGISAENLPKLFSPFFTTKPAGEGTGLGLAISYGIVHKHGGKLLVESSVGVGTQFTIEIPYKAVVSSEVKKICETAA